VVLVHGALATAGAWRPLRTRIENETGARTASFTYGPSSGVVEIARALGKLVAGLPDGVTVHLVGHSLGGLAVRWFVQEMPADARVVQTVSVAAPFEGARGARLFPGRAGRDMRRGSAVLERLADSAAGSALPHLSIFGTTDTAVSGDTHFPVGERLVLPYAGHNALLFHDGVGSAIVERIRAIRAGSASNAR
jgi:pimeloyl-ACP methyl ester carboxylesterase